MAKNTENIQVTGRIVESLPNAFFRVELENSVRILGHLSGRMRMHNISIKLGDRVDMEMSPYDLTKGRIIFRHKIENQPKK